MTGLIDSHSHLTFSAYDEDREEVLKRAFDGGLEALVVIGSGGLVDENFNAVKFAKEHENVYATIGIHPHDAGKVDLDEAISKLTELAKEEKVVAIGEVGLDYHYMHSSAESQLECFRRFLKLAHELKLSVIIHDREAHNDVLYTLHESKYEFTGGIFHCFSGDVFVARQVLDLGFYISIPGVITFKKADELRKVVKEVPIEKLLIETDCPYLAPVPYRGKRNEPLYVKYVAEEIAKIKGLSLEDVARITTLNTKRVLNLPGMVPIGKITYPIRKSMYLNITNRCTLGCTFCPKRSGSFEVKGHNLKLEQEPNVEDIFRAIGTLEGYEEIVFCGFGEPTIRLELLKVIAKELKEKGVKVRLDTDGLGSLIHERDILPELEGLIDSVSVSMNAPTPEKYQEICPSKYGDQAFLAMLSFLEKAKEFIPEVTASVVTVPGVDIDACKKLAKDLGVHLRLRQYQDVG